MTLIIYSKYEMFEKRLTIAFTVQVSDTTIFNSITNACPKNLFQKYFRHFIHHYSCTYTNIQ